MSERTPLSVNLGRLQLMAFLIGLLGAGGLVYGYLHERGNIERHGPVRHVGGNEEHGARLADAGFIADREGDFAANEHSPLFMRMAVQGNLGPRIHFQIRQHQVFAMRRAQAASRHGLDDWIVLNVDKSHNGSRG
jgi:hypothetical protein